MGSANPSHRAAHHPVAPSSDAVRALRFLESGKDYHRPLLDEWLPSTGLVIDVGCGLGRVTNFYDSPHRRVVGVDLDRDSLQLAEAVGRKPFLVGDACALPFPDGSAGAYVGLGIVELDPTGGARVLAEAHRILHNGGIVYLTVPFLNRRRAGSSSAEWRGERVHAFSAETATRLLTSVGFSVERTRPSSLAHGLGRFGRPAARLFPSIIGREDESGLTYRLIAPALQPYANSLLVVGRKFAN
jgi:SAM-dependent methyltransferase